MAQYKLPEKWEEWPIKEVTMGGVKRKVKHDPETSAIYLLDERGEWTGKKGMAPTQKTAGNTETAENSAAEGEKEATSTGTPTLTKKVAKKSKANPILIVIIIILAALLLMKGNGGSVGGKSYEVVIAMENIQPGESLEGKLASATITEEEYRKYINEGGMYSPSEYEQIKFYVATSFIPKDGYITYTNVGEEYNKSNPWMQNAQDTTITIPVDVLITSINTYMWGDEATLTVTTRKRLSSSSYPGSDHPEAPGIGCTSTLETVQVDTYVLKNLTIVDVLDGRGESLYSRWAAQAAIPSLYQADCIKAHYETLSDVQSDMPNYVVLSVSAETYEWWMQISSSLYTRSFAISVTGVNCATELQDNTYTALQRLVEVMMPIWESVEQEA